MEENRLIIEKAKERKFGKDIGNVVNFAHSVLLFTFLVALLFYIFINYRMTYISIDTKTKQAKKFLELIETLPYAKVLEEPNAITKKAMADAKQHKTKKHKDAASLISYLNK